MDGAELLAEIAIRYPAAVRVILSGCFEADSVMRTVGHAHQFLAKPCAPQVVVGVIRRAFELRRMLSSEPLRELVNGLKSLPSPSDTYFLLVEYMSNPNASANGLAEIIGRDVAMTAELLKLTNSGYFSLPTRLSTPLQAIRILGFETLQALVLRIGIFRHFKGLPAMGRLVEELNHDSFLVGRIARRIAKTEGLDARRQEEEYCAGMLCSVGMLVLLDQMPEQYAKVKWAVAGGKSPLDAEKEVFGATHLQLGAYLLGLWGFNKTVVEAVAFLGQPSATHSIELEAAGIVHAARVIAGASPAYAVPGKGATFGRLALDVEYLKLVGKYDHLSTWMAEAATEQRH
jgi:HD-like signal output (HDOD) protein